MRRIVRIENRGMLLAPSSTVVPLDEEHAFCALDEPPPAGSIVELKGEGGDIYAMRVEHVHETVQDGAVVRGFRGRYVDVACLHERSRVGTERLRMPGENDEVAMPRPQS